MKNSYGKRPVWFWVATYAVVGALIYAAVYLLFLSGGGGTGY